MERGSRDLSPGAVVWVDFGGRFGREQDGRRPAVAIAADECLRLVDHLVLVAPVTSRDRGWWSHVRLDGPTNLARPSRAMSEQIGAIDRGRVARVVGSVSAACLSEIRGSVVRLLVG